MPAPKKRLGDLLLENSMITESQLEEALKAQAMYGGKLGTNLIELGYVSETELTNFLSVQLNIPAANPQDFAGISKAAIDIIPKEIAHQHKIIPLSFSGKRLKVATSDPYDIKIIDDLAFKTSYIIDLVIAPEILIVYALEAHYGIARKARYIKLTGVSSEEMKLTETMAENIHSSIPDQKAGGNPYPPDRVSIDLAEAPSKEQVFSILIKFFEYYFEKICVFVVRHQTLHGFINHGFDISNENFRKIQIPLDQASTFKEVADTKKIWKGKISGTEIDAVIASTLKHEQTSESYMVPLLLNNQTACIMLSCDQNKKIKELPIRDFDIVSKKISFAFQIQFLRKRILSHNE